MFSCHPTSGPNQHEEFSWLRSSSADPEMRTSEMVLPCLRKSEALVGSTSTVWALHFVSGSSFGTYSSLVPYSAQKLLMTPFPCVSQLLACHVTLSTFRGRPPRRPEGREVRDRCWPRHSYFPEINLRSCGDRENDPRSGWFIAYRRGVFCPDWAVLFPLYPCPRGRYLSSP